MVKITEMKQCMFMISSLLLLVMNACKQEEHSIKIGAFIWSDLDLNAIIFQNGDSLLCADDSILWRETCESHTPAYCHIPNYDAKEGLLYNYWAMCDERNIAPKGWHVAKVEEWQYIISIDSLNLCGVSSVYRLNKMNFKRRSARYSSDGNDPVEYCRSHDFEDGSEYWAWHQTAYSSIHVVDSAISPWGEIREGGINIYRTHGDWNFEKFDETNNYNAQSPYRGFLIRCVKDY